MTTVTAAVSGKPGCMLAARIVSRSTRMPLEVMRFVWVKTVEGVFAAFRNWPGVSMMRIVAVVYVAIEAWMAVKPRPCSDKDTAIEPIRPVVAIRGTRIRSVIEIAIRTYRRDTDAHPYLSRCNRCATEQCGS